MLALPEFDAKELARFSGTKLSTVRTTIQRRRDLLEIIGHEETGHRGGKSTRYRVSPDQIPELEKKLDDLLRGLSFPDRHEQTSGLLSASLSSAESALLKRFPSAETIPDKKRLLELAEMEAPRSEAEILSAPMLVQTHIRSLVALIELCKTELSTEDQCGSRLPTLRDGFVAAADGLMKVGDFRKASELFRRLVESPVTEAAIADYAKMTPVLTEIPDTARDSSLETGLPVFNVAAMRGDSRASNLVEYATPIRFSKRSESILVDVKEIGALQNAQRRLERAFAAAETRWDEARRAGVDVEPELQRFLHRIEHRPSVRLTDCDVDLLSTTPAFYCGTVLGIPSRPILRVYAFLRAMEDLQTRARQVFPSGTPRFGHDYERKWAAIQEFAGKQLAVR